MFWRRKKQIHFLHIGKNAGTQIKHIAKQINREAGPVRIVSHGHNVRLVDLPAGAAYFFSLRSPEQRFRSAFYSRKRQGRPRHHIEWTDDERQAFSTFEKANDLAEALFEEGKTGFEAFCAMKSISHCAMNQVDWFARAGAFLELHPPIAIIRQEEFDADMAFLLRKLGLNAPHEATQDPAASHANDYSGAPALSDKAKANLAAWYAQDVEFRRRCLEWIAENQTNG